MIHNLKVNLILTISLLLTPSLAASSQDLHRLWDDRCATCHNHAGDFSRQFLSVSNGELQGKHHTHDLRLFLKNHYLAGHSVDAVYNMLLAQTKTDPRFKSECSSCHANAANFLRNSIILRDSVLYSRKLNIPVRDFLNGHRNLQPDDVDFFMQQLTRIAHEIFQP